LQFTVQRKAEKALDSSHQSAYNYVCCFGLAMVNFEFNLIKTRQG